jgi:hypothetical protein
MEGQASVMKSGGPLKRTTPLTAKTGLQRTTPMQQRAGRESLSARTGSKDKSAPKRRRRSTVDLRTALTRRSGGVCEMALDGCQGRAVDPCHRVGTGMGGRHGDAVAVSDRPSNAVFGCRSCHDWQHTNVGMAKAYGLILPNGADPLREPVLLRYGVVLLGDDGTWTLCPPATAWQLRQRFRKDSA